MTFNRSYNYIPNFRPNVCTEHEEDIEDIKGANDSSEEKNANSQTFHFGLHLSVNSCVERSNKYVCTST